MKRVYDFLKEAGTYYLATVEGDQPRVRPFGTVNIFEDKLYIQTGKVKPVSKQIAANGKVEICAFKDGVFHSYKFNFVYTFSSVNIGDDLQFIIREKVLNLFC